MNKKNVSLKWKSQHFKIFSISFVFLFLIPFGFYSILEFEEISNFIRPMYIAFAYLIPLLLLIQYYSFVLKNIDKKFINEKAIKLNNLRTGMTLYLINFLFGIVILTIIHCVLRNSTPGTTLITSSAKIIKVVQVVNNSNQCTNPITIVDFFNLTKNCTVKQFKPVILTIIWIYSAIQFILLIISKVHFTIFQYNLIMQNKQK